MSCRRRRSWRLKPRQRGRVSCGPPWPACQRTFRSFHLFATYLCIKALQSKVRTFVCVANPPLYLFINPDSGGGGGAGAGGEPRAAQPPPAGRRAGGRRAATRRHPGCQRPCTPVWTLALPSSLRDARLAATLAARDQVPRMQRCPACCVMQDSAALITGAAQLAAKDQAPQVRHAQFVGDAEWQPGAAEHDVLGHRRRNVRGHSWWRSTSSGRRRRRQSTQPRYRGCSGERRSSSSPGRRRRPHGQQLSQAWSRPSVMPGRSWKPLNSSLRCSLVPDTCMSGSTFHHQEATTCTK